MRPLAIFLCLALCLPAAAASEPELRVPLERYKLSNGLTVILHEDHRLPQVVVNLWFQVGSKDERARRTGFAHLFEHLMFMGTQAVPDNQFDTIMEAAGGSNNASTNEDRTNYFETGPANLLETFLWLEADRLRTLPEAMTLKKVALQREVVKNERRQSYENRPYGGVELVLPEKLFPAAHPYQHPVIGTHADLTAAGVEDVKAFFRAYYVPSNSSLVVAGDFKPSEARRLVEKYFAPLARVPVPQHAVPPPVALAKAARVVLADAVQLDQVTMAWHAPAALEPGHAETELLAAVLGGAKSSRLKRALVYDTPLAQEVEVAARPMRYGGMLVVKATAQPGRQAEELERAIATELARLEKEPPTAREIERARAFVQTRELQKVASLFGMADTINEWEYLRGDPAELERSYVARFARLGPSEVAWRAHAVLSRPAVTVVVKPKRARPADREVQHGR